MFPHPDTVYVVRGHQRQEALAKAARLRAAADGPGAPLRRRTTRAAARRALGTLVAALVVGRP